MVAANATLMAKVIRRDRLLDNVRMKGVKNVLSALIIFPPITDCSQLGCFTLHCPRKE